MANCHNQIKNHGLRFFYLSLILLISSIYFVSLASATEEQGRVLFISSYHPSFPTFFQQVDGVKDTFKGTKIILDIEFMDTKRFPDHTNVENFETSLAYKLSLSPPYDVFMVADDNALSFALAHKDSLFKDKPIVFLGVNNVALALEQNLNPRVTGVVESVSMKDTIHLMTRLQPTCSRIVALVDGTPSGQGDLKTFYSLSKDFPGYTFGDISLETLSWDDFLVKVGKLGNESAVLLLSAYRDKNNNACLFGEGLERIENVLTVPLYHLWYHGLGDGILGGKVISHYEQGKAAAGMVRDILGGKPVQDIAVVTESPNRYIFDDVVLRRFGIKKSELPEQSIILNQPDTFYNHHKNIIWLTVFIFIVLGTFLMIALITIVQRRKIEEKLRKSHERFLTVLESIDATIYVADMDTHEILFMNKFMIESFGRDMTGEICWDALYGENGPCGNCTNHMLINKNGEPLGVYIWQDHNQETGRWHTYHDRAIEWTDGRMVRLQIGTDITAMKMMEDELRKDAKIEAVGTLAGGIAHDFNNILGIIIGNTELALEDVPEDHPARISLEEINIASIRARDVVRQLLSFSRKTEQKKKPIQLNAIIHESIQLLRALIPKNIDFSVSAPDSLGTIMADPTQIQQVIINLCTNSAHAMEEKGGTLGISITEVDLVDDQLIRSFNLKSGTYIQVQVSDTGCGIETETIDRVFDPYFTTKELNKGTGLGLSVVHGIVRNHGGAISITSEPDKGTTVTILLPVVAEHPVQENETTEELPRGRGNERILFVDDEESLANMGRHMLERLGYQVQVNTSSVDALEQFRLDPGRFDLIITDMAMPQMTGDQLARHVMKIRPDMPIILCTGFSEKMNRDIAEKIGIAKYIEKPVNKQELAFVIRDVLDNHRVNGLGYK